MSSWITSPQVVVAVENAGEVHWQTNVSYQRERSTIGPPPVELGSYAVVRKSMDDIGTRILEAFSKFPRPESIVIHIPEDECFDCTDVEDSLRDLDCKRILEDSSFKFATMPMDCLNAKAFLHYLPAIVAQSFEPDGISVAETVAWILGADEWDTVLTISEQIKPMLSVHQYHCVRDYLNVLDGSAFCEQARNNLDAAKRNWETLCD